jgi:hypothetical protein
MRWSVFALIPVASLKVEYSGTQASPPGSSMRLRSTLPAGRPARYGGRKKGGGNRFGGDLREAVVAGIAAVGFTEKGEDGKPKHGQGAASARLRCSAAGSLASASNSVPLSRQVPPRH